MHLGSILSLVARSGAAMATLAVPYPTILKNPQCSICANTNYNLEPIWCKGVFHDSPPSGAARGRRTNNRSASCSSVGWSSRWTCSARAGIGRNSACRGRYRCYSSLGHICSCQSTWSWCTGAIVQENNLLSSELYIWTVIKQEANIRQIYRDATRSLPHWSL